MNLSAYDVVNPKIDKQRTWVDIHKKQLLSREIVFRPYVTISKRYVKEDNSYEYFIILLDDCPFDRPYSNTKKDNYGRIKIRLASIWKESSLKYLEKDINIELIPVEHADDGDIYLLNV